ncbi:hypothetical protein FQV37_772 [Psychrobacter nivimaris]|uniref:RiboL-PSP-HEPN domain-containing protein n=1 Tax=Psychrobacter nivimaris TaxID=281738 RepID=A0A6N7BYK9_9GAMM|nr:MAE_28990/MAE_18760 family HEPN-like nuclease [Psychrobacter nivimaris]KAF0568714.1 hypothetical protein FQV37_772 [Psychrobacter nivimaris]|tara:strand:- start:842 stop:1525 length:684 start_codon:yes stop_codon:yes gene_type:complete
MTFDSIRRKNNSRFNEVQVYLNFITSLEPQSPQGTTSNEVKIMRGLFYVHLYAVIEKSVNEMVETTISIINSSRVQSNHFTLEFNTIAKINKIQAIKDCSNKKMLIKSADLFEEINSTRVVEINETSFSMKLQNIWADTIEEILTSFGIKNFRLETEEKVAVNEIVDNRNKVAHGRETAVKIGERHRADALRRRLNTAQLLISKVLDSLEDFYTRKAYIKPVARRRY